MSGNEMNYLFHDLSLYHGDLFSSFRVAWLAHWWSTAKSHVHSDLEPLLSEPVFDTNMISSHCWTFGTYSDIPQVNSIFFHSYLFFFPALLSLWLESGMSLMGRSSEWWEPAEQRFIQVETDGLPVWTSKEWVKENLLLSLFCVCGVFFFKL